MKLTASEKAKKIEHNGEIGYFITSNMLKDYLQLQILVPSLQEEIKTYQEWINQNDLFFDKIRKKYIQMQLFYGLCIGFTVGSICITIGVTVSFIFIIYYYNK